MLLLEMIIAVSFLIILSSLATGDLFITNCQQYITHFLCSKVLPGTCYWLHQQTPLKILKWTGSIDGWMTDRQVSSKEVWKLEDLPHLQATSCYFAAFLACAAPLFFAAFLFWLVQHFYSSAATRLLLV